MKRQRFLHIAKKKREREEIQGREETQKKANGVIPRGSSQRWELILSFEQKERAFRWQNGRVTKSTELTKAVITQTELFVPSKNLI